MKKTFISCFAFILSLFTAAAFATPGELWEITSKTEMPGMPFAMPGSTQQVCMSKGSTNDPRQSSQDKSCKMTDIRTSGNKTTWKMRCNHDGEIMNGSGEQTTTRNSFQGVTHLSGKSGGENVDMTMRYSGKNLGKSCDASQPSKMAAQAQQQIAQSCETSGRSAAELIAMSDMYLAKGVSCTAKREAMCSAVRKKVGSDAEAYDALAGHDKHLAPGSVSVAKACGINMAATTKSVCKTFNGKKNYRKLAPYCPAEAKAYRVAMRKKECEGRSYTAQENLSKCLSGDDSKYAGNDDSASGTVKSSNPADSVIEGAKKLKGLFGF